MDKTFHPTLFNGFNYLSMLGLKLNQVRKRGPRTFYAKATLHLTHLSFLKQQQSHPMRDTCSERIFPELQSPMDSINWSFNLIFFIRFERTIQQISPETMLIELSSHTRCEIHTGLNINNSISYSMAHDSWYTIKYIPKWSNWFAPGDVTWHPRTNLVLIKVITYPFCDAKPFPDC